MNKLDVIEDELANKGIRIDWYSIQGKQGYTMIEEGKACLLYTSNSPRSRQLRKIAHGASAMNVSKPYAALIMFQRLACLRSSCCLYL